MKDFQTTILIDLSKTKEELWNALDRSRRKNINKAGENKLSIEEIDIYASGHGLYFSDFYNLYRKVWAHGGIEVDSYDTLRDRLMNKGYKFFLCFKDGKIIGGAMICENYPGRWKFSIVACDSAYNEFRPNDFLYWYLILYIKSLGAKFCDLGGYQEKPKDNLIGVNRFKEMWGGQIHRDEIEGNVLKMIGRKAFRNIPLVRKVVNKIKGRKSTVFKPKNN